MRAHTLILASFAACGLLLVALGVALAQEPENTGGWKIHDMDRPQPTVITPPTASTEDAPGAPPSDAIVLFDGTDTSAWVNESWKVEDGAMLPGRGDTRTKEGFGDCQLHVEWASPAEVKGEGQGRGNSGVYLMGLYEVQVLDCYENRTYPDGQASAIYGQFPPLVNACRKPGEWQTYDIIFRAPRFDDEGKLLSPATMTVLHNGVLTQNHVTLTGPSGHHSQPPYKAHGDKMPLKLQDHGNPVRYRNIWIREL